MKELEGAEPQDGEDLDVQPGGGTARKAFDDVVESTLPAERACGDFSGERAIALVAQARPRLSERRRQIRAPRPDRQQGFVCRGTSRRDHDWKRSPSTAPRPARKSRAVI